MWDTFWKNISFVNALLWTDVIICVLMVLDIKEIPSALIGKYGSFTIITIGIAIVLFIILGIIKKHWFSIFKIPCGNKMDELLVIGGLICLGYFLADMTFLEKLCAWTYKALMSIIGFAVFFMLFIVRIFICRPRNNKSERFNNVISLHDFYETEISVSEEPLFFSDSPSESDMLDREVLIRLLHDSIVNSCETTRSFVIGVKGPWGSGKTTLINLVKNKVQKDNKDIVFIDEFDPWIFGSQEALLEAMYDEILSKLGNGYSVYSNRAMIKKIQDVVAQKDITAGIVKNLIDNESNDYCKFKEMKSKLATLLKQLNKTIVYIIDNIDRADEENVVFLLKVISTVFDLPKVKYILAYDSQRLNDILSNTKKINPKYLEKIIQQEIEIPKISLEATERVEEGCIVKLLKYYGVKESEMKEYDTVIKTILDCVVDLRQLKRLFNSAFVTTFECKYELYRPYLLAVEIIRFLKPELLRKIKENPVYFVSSNVTFKGYAWQIMDSENYKKTGKLFYEELLELFPKYIKLLESLFPYVKYFLCNHVVEENNVPEDTTTAIPISSGFFFDLYLSYGNNSALQRYQEMNNFISQINSSDSHAIEEIVRENIKTINYYDMFRWLAQLQKQSQTIILDKKLDVAKGLCKSLRYIEDEIRYKYVIKNREKAIEISLEMVKDLDKDAVESFTEDMISSDDILSLYYMRRKCDDYPRFDLNRINNAFEKKCYDIVKGNIDLFDDNHYFSGCIRVLLYSECGSEFISKYLKRELSEKNIYRIVVECLTANMDNNGYGYNVNRAMMNKFLDEKQVMKCLLTSTEPRTEFEKAIIDIWKKTAEKKDIVYFDEPLNYRL